MQSIRKFQRQKRSNRWYRTLGTLGVVGALLLTGCTGGEKPTPTDQPDSPVVPAGVGTDEEFDSFTLGASGDMASVDPTKALNTAAWSVFMASLEPLLKISPDGSLAPVLAESWDLSSPTTIDVTLRDGVTFWDGSPLTPEDVVFSLQHNTDPLSSTAYLYSNFESAEVSGENQVRITLSAPQPEFVSHLAMLFIVQKDFAEAAGEDLGTPQTLTMGTGPFKIDSFTSGVGADLSRYDGYWGDLPTAKTIEVRFISDPQALRLAMQSGEIDGTFDVPVSDASSWESLSGVNVGFATGTAPDFFLLDTTQAPFDDIHARRAFASVVDQAGIVAAIYNGKATPAPSLVSPLLWATLEPDQAAVDAFYETLPPIKFDLDAAAEELAQSATPDGFDLTLKVPTDVPSYSAIGEAVAQSAAEIGINITLEPVTISAWFDALQAETKDPLGILGWSGNASTPLAIPLGLLTTTPSAPNPWTSWQSESMFDAFDRFRNSTDPADQLAASKDVVSELAEKIPFVPIAYGDLGIAISDEFALTIDYSSWKYYGGNNWAAAVKLAAE